MKALSKFDAVGFISNILAVILGIVITFSIQALIDRKEQKENIHSALSLVKEELEGCREELESCADILDKERVATKYLQQNLKNLDSCPADTVSDYGILYLTEMMLTLPEDALELLKTSSLFSAIDDNTLSLAIIRAYDQCKALCEVFNRHEEQKTELIKDIFLKKGVDKCLNSQGNISITELMNTNEGMFLTTQLSGGMSHTLRNGLKDVDAAIDMIDGYLAR